LRAIGIIAVFMTHSGFATGTTLGSTGSVNVGPFSGRPASLLGHLEIGPAIFFMISAFLLYRPFVRAAFADAAPPTTRKFLRRRFVRVFPAYWAAVVLLYALGWIHTHGWFHMFRVLTLTQIYTQRGFFAIDVLVPTWTLSTEVSFYVFLVVWAMAMRRACSTGRDPRTRLKVELAGCIILSLFAFFFRVVVYHHVLFFGHALPEVAEHWLPGTLDLFAVGMAFAAIDAYARAHGNGAPRVGPIASDLCAVFAVFWFFAVPLFTNASEGITYSTGWDAYGRDFFQLLCSGFLLLPLAFIGSSGGLYRRFTELKPIAYIGLVSYGFYLWHDEWIVRAVQWSGGRVALQAPYLLVGISAFALAVASGALSYRLLEQPLLEVEAGRRRLSWPWRPPAPAPVPANASASTTTVAPPAPSVGAAS
jgi:peptidoglycan/LPS O-acetylase OafA/YrhL